jgi:2-dehydro-3-deoxygluconokinase
MTDEMKIAAIGECMIELSAGPNSSMALRYGGDTLNTAVYLARLSANSGPAVDYLTALGDDPYSDEMEAFWQREGLGTGLVARLPGRLPGLYTIRTDQAGERSFHYWRGASAAREMLAGAHGERLLAALAGYQMIYLSGITLSILTAEHRERLLDALDRARAAGARIAFDSNYRPRGWPDSQTARDAMDEMYRRCHIALPGLADECALHGELDAAAAARRIAGLGAGEVCIKDGGNGCLVAWDGKAESLAAEAAITAVDTTAAGDSFNAAYLHARLGGAGPATAARAGHRLAARVIQHPGAVIPPDAMPEFEQLA